VAEPRYLSACTRATTVFAILTVFFAVKPGLAFLRFLGGSDYSGLRPRASPARVETGSMTGWCVSSLTPTTSATQPVQVSTFR
jgi:hypothetical protein